MDVESEAVHKLEAAHNYEADAVGKTVTLVPPRRKQEPCLPFIAGSNPYPFELRGVEKNVADLERGSMAKPRGNKRDDLVEDVIGDDELAPEGGKAVFHHFMIRILAVYVGIYRAGIDE